MRALVAAGLGWAALVSCASVPGPTDAEVAASVYRALGGPSVVAGLEVSLQTDFVFERVALVRVSTPRGPAPDEPVGVSLGNGLFLDNAGNLVLRADAVLGVGASFVGTTVWEGPTGTQRVAYDGRKLTVDPAVPGPWGPRFDVVPSFPISFPDLLLSLDAAGTLTVDHRNVLAENQTWTPVAGGYTRTLPLQRTQTVTLGADGVSDDRGWLRVTAQGDHLLVSYRPGAGPGYRVRIYRSDTRYLVIDDRTGAMTSFDVTPVSFRGQGVSLVVQPRLP